MKEFNLTTLQEQFIRECINYENLSSQQSDNYCNAGMGTAIKITGSKHGGAGLIGSLLAKGLGDMDGDGYDIFWLDDDILPQLFKELGLDLD